MEFNNLFLIDGNNVVHRIVTDVHMVEVPVFPYHGHVEEAMELEEEADEVQPCVEAMTETLATAIIYIMTVSPLKVDEVDEMEVDELEVDEMEVDKMEVDEMETVKIQVISNM